MRKTRILLICALLAVLTCVFLVGCSRKEKISSIELKDNGSDAVIEFQIGKFDYDAHTLIVNYDSGSVKELALGEDMISELDRLKFYQPGEHTINILYGGKTCEVKISVKRDTFGDISFPENTVFTYNGQEHTVELEGDIPPNANVTYIGGNSFVNAGNYDVTAVVTCNGYVTKKISTTVTVERLKYDMSNVKFESKEIVYDGRSHSIQISGKLPEGVSAPTYTINGSKNSGAVDVDEYIVTASFSNNDPNYEPIPSMTATLKIIPAEYSLGDIELIFKSEDNTEHLLPWKKYDGKGVTFDINNSHALKDKVNISYTVLDEQENVISKSNIDTNIKNVGVYTVKVDFSLLDNKNYKDIEPKTYTFEIDEAGFDMTDIVFESKDLEYDGSVHSLSIVFPADYDMTKFDVSYEYFYFGDDETIKENGENVTGVSRVGEYTVKAIFTVNDPNYEQIPDMQAKLVISKKKISTSQYIFYNTNLIYTGESLKPGFSFDNSENVKVGSMVVYKLDGESYTEIDNAIDAGEYRVGVIVSLIDTENYVFDNGKSEVEIVEAFTIQEAEIDISDLKFDPENPSNVNKGSSHIFVFDTAKVEGVSFNGAIFCRVEGDKLVSVVDDVSTMLDENGLISIVFDAVGLEAGRYACVVTVSAEDGKNHVLSNGNDTAEYVFEFNILD